ncbi:beta-galactosidase [Maritalea mediterranea]|uniref:Beta-galactosidase n=1 Tax=Maritalea mediterranea TaxID=2909667 RepID=A0ABS9E5P3_9HYPH|nr:beta-galactosidase [Maritalea mediterranea]MCF4098132.1 beta-galactosidase [Maritalea mediterranea]
MTQKGLGVCYYPEHWPREMWASDVQRMADIGLTWVRIGEFAWSRIEPKPGQFEWAWLDQAVETLADAGLKIVLGTPTATPPRWMLSKHPDMLAVDAQGRPRKFGSRRHYCFSHEAYKKECARIVRLLAERYGDHPAICAWQTDNEYGCHDTTISYSDAARQGFQKWLAARYDNIAALNDAWGNVFWSMEYAAFDEVDLPNLTVTEANPAHQMAFRRFSSDQVVAFNKLQVDEIRAKSTAPVIHNYMGRITDFDHYQVAADLDIASWDSYPLGFLEDRIEADDEFKNQYLKQGHPDYQAFHHDLYRAVGRGRWWIMEQQPGPVNWAPYNPAPLPGMVRLWALEAFAHGAENVLYFRWRQAPFAQEQMHTGLYLPDDSPNVAANEAKQVAQDLSQLQADQIEPARVALIFDYESQWASEIQPQGQGFDYFDLVFHYYKALRRLGCNIDILPPNATNFGDYTVIFAPGVVTLTQAQQKALRESGAKVVLGPRTNAKTSEFSIPPALPPNFDGLPLKITNVESLRPSAGVALEKGQIRYWFEHIEGEVTPILNTEDGRPAIVEKDNLIYCAGWLDETALFNFVGALLGAVDIPIEHLPDGLRRRETSDHVVYLNYAPIAISHRDAEIPPAGVHFVRK